MQYSEQPDSRKDTGSKSEGRPIFTQKAATVYYMLCELQKNMTLNLNQNCTNHLIENLSEYLQM